MDLENLNGPSHYGTLLPLLQNAVAEFGTALAQRLKRKKKTCVGGGLRGEKNSLFAPGRHG